MLGEAAGEAEAFGLAAGEAAGEVEAFGLALTDGDGIAGLVETVGTFGLADGVVVAFLQAPNIVRSINTKVMIAIVLFIL